MAPLLPLVVQTSLSYEETMLVYFLSYSRQMLMMHLQLSILIDHNVKQHCLTCPYSRRHQLWHLIQGYESLPHVAWPLGLCRQNPCGTRH
jgi:hypothetical protein